MIFRVRIMGRGAHHGGALSSKRLRILYTQEFHAGRRNQCFTEPVHRLRGLLVRLDAAFPKLITLIETLDLQFELRRRPGRAAWAVSAPLLDGTGNLSWPPSRITTRKPNGQRRIESTPIHTRLTTRYDLGDSYPGVLKIVGY